MPMNPSRATAQTIELLTIDDIQRICRVCRSKAYELVREMPQVMIGRGVRVRREAFEAWLHEREELPCNGPVGR
jgi:excisionase family DNA binding protein